MSALHVKKRHLALLKPITITKMNTLKKLIIGFAIYLSLFAGIQSAQAKRYQEYTKDGIRVFRINDSRNYMSRYNREKNGGGAAILVLILGGSIAMVASASKKNKNNSSSSSDKCKENVMNIVRRVPSTLDYPLYGLGSSLISYESPETAIARRRPDIAAGVLETTQRANFANKGLEAITRMAESYRDRQDISEIAFNATATERNFLGIPLRRYSFKAEVKLRK